MKLRILASVAVVVVLASVMVLSSLGVFPTPGTAPASQLPGLSSANSTASVVVGAFSKAAEISPEFWGVDVEPTQRFITADAASVAATPVTYIRFPGGRLAEELNYTSGVVTALNGSTSKTETSTATFVASCKSINCHAIMQLPTEIDSPATAAYYASYVVKTLGYQPAYWELGNSPAGWIHFGVPWSEWKTKQGGNTTPVPFADEVHSYVQAVEKVDPAAKFLALGAGMGGKDYSKAWVEELAKIDGKNLSGISVHSYIIGGPSKPTDAQLFANLNGIYSLPAQVSADRGYIKDGCSTCTNMSVFVTEINAAETSSYTSLLTSFAGTLYLAADTVQGLSYQVTNLDWFCYDCGFTGAWSQHPLTWQMQYYLFSDVMTHLRTETLPTTVTGPSSLYGIATYDASGLSLLLVNVNTTASVSVNMADSGFKLDKSGVTDYSWQNGAKLPSESTVSLSSTLKLPAMSITLLTVGTAGTKSPSGQASPISTAAVAPTTPGPAQGSSHSVAGVVLLSTFLGLVAPLGVIGVVPLVRKGPRASEPPCVPSRPAAQNRR